MSQPTPPLDDDLPVGATHPDYDASADQPASDPTLLDTQQLVLPLDVSTGDS